MSFQTIERKTKKEDYDRFFKKKDNKKAEKIFHFQEQSFPNLIKEDEPKNNNNEENIISGNNIKSFAQMASLPLPKINEVATEEIIKPGWMSIQYDRNTRKTIIRNGEKTRWRIEYEKKEKEMNSLNYQMNKAVENMKKNHRQYIAYYNDVYGEGAYEEKFMYEVELSDEEDASENEEDSNSI